MISFSEVCNLAIKQLESDICRLESKKYVLRDSWSSIHGYNQHKNQKIENYTNEIKQLNSQIEDIKNKNILAVVGAFKDIGGMSEDNHTRRTSC